MMSDQPTHEELLEKIRALEALSSALRDEVQALRQTALRYESIFNSAADAFVVYDAHGHVVHANPEAMKMYGYSYDEIIRLRGYDMIHSKYRHLFDQFIENVSSRGHFQTESLDVRKDGAPFPVEVRGTEFYYQGKRHFLAMVRDISKRKLAEKALKEARDELERRVEERTLDLASANENLKREIHERRIAEDGLKQANLQLEALINATPDVVYFKDIDGRNLIANKGFASLIGLDRKDIIGKTDEEILSPEIAARCRSTDRDVAESGKLLHFEETAPGLDGKTRYFDTIKAPIYNACGHFQGLVGISRDITTRKQAEEILKESEERFRKFADEAFFEGIIFLEEGRILDVNQRFATMYGYDMTELIGRDPLETIAPESREKVKRNIQEKYERPYEAIGLRKDGTTFPTEIHAKMILLHGKEIRVASTRDLTQQKRTEEERRSFEAAFRESQKMEAIGTLAGGIAHDFNNLLMAIQGHTSLMLLDLEPGHPHTERLKKIEEAVQSGSDLTKQLLGFAMAGKYEVSPTDINQLIRKSFNLFGRTKKEITIHEKYQEGIWIVDADQGQIEQVMLNLYVNAWQAMPRGGDLHLETENITLKEEDVEPYQVEAGPYVKITLRDTGIGMDEATLERIFDPFFTTKEMGRGAGLGLAAVYGIVRNHGGFIRVLSREGQGTSFHIFLPASDKEVNRKKRRHSPLERGSETVLLVDDEGTITDIGEEMLQTLGYKAIIAHNGREAVDLYREHMDRVDLVILDMIMPEMSGGETYDILKQIDPDIKVLLSSGYSIDGEASEILERGCTGFIQKPFTVNDLSQKIRGILGAGPSK